MPSVLSVQAVLTVISSAALSAHAALTCSVLSERITITPGNVPPGGLDTYGLFATDSYVIVPGTIDGIYDT